VLSGRGLCDELITRPEESYRLCCVVLCDLETSIMGAPYIYDISRLRVNNPTALPLRNGPSAPTQKRKSEPPELGLTFRRKEIFLSPPGRRTKFSVVVNPLRYPGSILDRLTNFNQIKNKSVALQAWTGPEFSRRLMLPDIKAIST